MTEQPTAIGLQHLLHDLRARVEERTRDEEQLRSRYEALKLENEQLRRQLEEASVQRQRLEASLHRLLEVIHDQREHLARVKAASCLLLEAIGEGSEPAIDSEQMCLDLDHEAKE